MNRPLVLFSQFLISCFFISYTNELTASQTNEIEDVAYPFLNSAFPDIELESIYIPGYSCAEDSIPVSIRIVNVSSLTILHPVLVSYQFVDSGLSISELITDTIFAGDTLDYTFNSWVMLNPANADRFINCRAWLSYFQDLNAMNDTSEVIQFINYANTPLPQISNTSVTYGQSINLNAVTNGVVLWYDSDTATDPLHIGNSYYTPPLFDTTTFWIEADRGVANIKITEVVQQQQGNGSTNPLPSWINGDMASALWGIEISNLGSQPADISGWQVLIDYILFPNEVDIVYSLPDSSWLDPGEVAIIDIRSDPIYTSLANNYFCLGITHYSYSYIAVGYAIRNAEGSIVDACATNYFTFLAETGITYLDFNGGIDCAGQAGMVRYRSDNNSSIDWKTSGQGYPSMGTLNSNIHFDNIPYSGICTSQRIPITVTITGQPIVDLRITNINAPEGCGLTTSEPIAMDIINSGSIPTSGVITASYRINNGPWTPEDTLSGSISPGQNYHHVFSERLDLHTHKDTSYYVQVKVANNGGTYFTSDHLFHCCYESLFEPFLFGSQTANLPYGSKATLSAVSNGTVFWFEDQSGSVSIGSGSSFITDYNYSSDTLWAQAFASELDRFQIGVGDTFNASPSYPSPYGNVHSGSRHQMLYLASELQDAGLEAGYIYGLAFNVLAAGTNGSGNLDISIGHTQIDSLSSFVANLINVYSPIGYMGTGWNWHQFDVPFYWNGKDNIVIETCHFHSNPHSHNHIFQLESSSFTSCIYNLDPYANICSVNTVYRRTKQRPVIKFLAETNIPVGCASTRIPIAINVGKAPPVDAGIVGIEISGCRAALYDTAVVEIRVRNYGLDTLNKALILMEVQGLDSIMIPFYNLDLSTFEDTILTIPYVFKQMSQSIRAWISMPNGVPDTVNTNDTSATLFVKTCMKGVYRIGNNPDAHFLSVQDAADTLLQFDFCGHITFEIDSGVYFSQIDFHYYSQANNSNTVTFRSASGIASDVVLEYDAASLIDNHTIRLNGSRYLNLEEFSIRSINSQYGTGILLGGGGNKHNSFRNLVIDFPSVPSIDHTGIKATGIKNSQNRITGNIVNNAYNAILLMGDSNLYSQGNIVDSNQINNAIHRGIHIQYQDSIVLLSNIIEIDSGSISPVGIEGNGISGRSEVFRNYVSGLSQQYFRGIFLSNCRGDLSESVLIANNMIAISPFGSINWNVGLDLQNLENTNVFHNTAHINSGDIHSTPFRLISSSNNRVRNNNFSTAAGGSSVAAILQYTQPQTIDFNNYYSNGSNIVEYNTALYSNLNAYTSMSSGGDAHSQSEFPAFVSSSDLHLSAPWTLGTGTPLADVPFDFDGDPFHPYSPAFGADAALFNLPTLDAGISSVYHPVGETVYGDSVTITAFIFNYGTDTLYTIPLLYSVGSSQSVNDVWNGILAPGDSIIHTFNSIYLGPIQLYNLCVSTALAGDTNTSNNQFCSSLDVIGAPVDAAMISILHPDTSTLGGTKVIVTVQVKNQSSNSLDSIPLFLTTSTGVSITEIWTGFLAVDDTLNYTFITSYLSPSTDYQLCASVSVFGDTASYNDEYCKWITANRVPYDIGLLEIIRPADTILIGNPQTCTALLQNLGDSTIITLDLKYTIGAVAFSEIWNGVLQPDDSMYFSFNSLFWAPVGLFQACIEANLSGDTIFGNNEICKVVMGLPGGVEDKTTNKIYLYQNIPNPSDGQTIIKYYVPGNGSVLISVIDMIGIEVFSDEFYVNEGTHERIIDVHGLPKGVYFYSLYFNDKRLTRKMLIQ